jgi:hypothetical protein
LSELDDLERDLLQAADTWFSQGLHIKLQRLIAIAREGRNHRVTVHALDQPGPFLEPLDESTGVSGDT